MYKLRKGTRVRIIKDARKGKLFACKLGKVAGWKKGKCWILFGADGIPETESYTLSDDYIEWNPKEENFPKVKCGVCVSNPIFLLEDGSKIYGSQCWWNTVNPKIMKKIESEYEELLKCSMGK